MPVEEMKKEKIFIVFAIAAVVIFYTIGPGCPQQAFLGISCLGCGMTRAYIQLLQGNLRNAFSYHPAFWAVPAASALFLFRNRLPKSLFRLGMGGFFLLFFLVYVYRLSVRDPVLIFDITKGYCYKIWSKLWSFYSDT